MQCDTSLRQNEVCSKYLESKRFEQVVAGEREQRPAPVLHVDVLELLTVDFEHLCRVSERDEARQKGMDMVRDDIAPIGSGADSGADVVTGTSDRGFIAIIGKYPQWRDVPGLWKRTFVVSYTPPEAKRTWGPPGKRGRRSTR